MALADQDLGVWDGTDGVVLSHDIGNTLGEGQEIVALMIDTQTNYQYNVYLVRFTYVWLFNRSIHPLTMCYNDIMLIKKMPPGMLRRVVGQVLLVRPPNSPLSPCSTVCCSVSTESPGSQRSNTATAQPGGALEALSLNLSEDGQFSTDSDRENT